MERHHLNPPDVCKHPNFTRVVTINGPMYRSRFFMAKA